MPCTRVICTQEMVCQLGEHAATYHAHLTHIHLTRNHTSYCWPACCSSRRMINWVVSTKRPTQLDRQDSVLESPPLPMFLLPGFSMHFSQQMFVSCMTCELNWAWRDCISTNCRSSGSSRAFASMVCVCCVVCCVVWNESN